MNKANDLKVWFFNNSSNLNIQEIPVDSVEEAEKIIRRLIENDLSRKEITDNGFGLFVYEDIGNGLEWNEWCNKDGSDIMEVIEEKDDKLTK